MRLIQIIFMGFLAVAFVAGLIKSKRKMIGGVIGGLVGLLIPVLLAALYVWRGGDSTAAGVFSFFCLLTIPVGIAIGVAVASQTKKGTEPLGKDSTDTDGK